ncbi:MAG TPA: beta-ketoacyl-[acyl-carrier-protein] synthase family protein [Bryobacteraceae bacterium]|nr:beta-ketoacyl-[acyl-carrier-protein] synthase family protein [Bryobacteraceae bacterium]
MASRIVVTGTGVITSIGVGLPAFEEALWSGKSGIKASGRIAGFTFADIGEFDPKPWLGNKGVRVLDRGTRLLCIAAQMALTETNLSQESKEVGDADLGMICGTMFGGIHSIASFDWIGITDGPSLVSPLEFPNTVINAPAGQAAIKHKLRGVNSTICSGLASGLYAIDYAAEFLRLGRAKYLLAGGMEEVCEETSAAFRRLNIESKRGQPNPFAADRDGAVAGESAALWMLEAEETAAGRGAKPILEILGFGAAHDASTSQGYQISGKGAATAMHQALDYSGITPDQISCIVTSGSGSPAGDEMEARALHSVFGDKLPNIPACAPKAALGECMGGSGALCAVIGGLALLKQELPPTAGFAGSDTKIRLSDKPQKITGDYALINAFSCDGNNSSLVIRRWQN